MPSLAGAVEAQVRDRNARQLPQAFAIILKICKGAFHTNAIATPAKATALGSGLRAGLLMPGKNKSKSS